jgi:plasmid stabilization system protein ParE
MMTLNDIEIKQSELLKKVQDLFANKNRTQKEMDELHDEIRKFEKEKASILYKTLMDETIESNIK